MILTIEQRRALREYLMRTGDWWEANGAAAANAAIPQPQRGLLTNRQKARLFVMILDARYKVT